MSLGCITLDYAWAKDPESLEEAKKSTKMSLNKIKSQAIQDFQYKKVATHR